MKLKCTFLSCLMLAFATCIMAQSTDRLMTGILLVHYGTGNDNSRAQTIDKLNALVAERFPECKVVEAYAASMVIRSLEKRGIKKLTIAQALDSIKAMGCTRLAVQSTMLLDGVMTDIVEKEVAKVRKSFQKVTVAKPLLYSVDDCRTLTNLIAENLKADMADKAEKSQVVLVGHGSDSPANAMYSQIDYVLKDEGRTSWHVGTIEGYPTIQCVERRLKTVKKRDVILVPLLYIAGNHQKEDIGGVWKQQLETAGYHVAVIEKGLGEMTQIQNMILQKLATMVE